MTFNSPASLGLPRRKRRRALLLLAASILAACSSPPQAAPTPTAPPPTPTRPPSTLTPTPFPPTPTATVPSPTATPVVRLRFGPGPVEIPVLLYHHVAPGVDAPRYIVSRETFEEQLTYLEQNGYATVTVSDVVAAIRDGADLPSNPIVLTFDDGNEDTYTEAWPRLRAHGFIGVVYVVANRVGAEGFLNADQLAELVGAGWEIGSHSMTHANLAEAPRTEWRQEILGSKLELQRVLGIEIRSFAYPFGVGNTEIFRKTAEYGYRSAVGLGKGILHDRGSIYYLERREVLGSWDLHAFEQALQAPP